MVKASASHNGAGWLKSSKHSLVKACNRHSTSIGRKEHLATLTQWEIPSIFVYIQI